MYMEEYDTQKSEINRKLSVCFRHTFHVGWIWFYGFGDMDLVACQHTGVAGFFQGGMEGKLVLSLCWLILDQERGVICRKKELIYLRSRIFKGIILH